MIGFLRISFGIPLRSPRNSTACRAVPDRIQATVPAAAEAIEVVLQRIVFGVVLVVALPRPEAGCVTQLHLQGQSGLPQFPRCGLGTGFGLLSLCRIGGEDHRPVGIAAIAELTAPVQWIHVAPVTAQQGAVADPGRIKAHLHHLLMACGFAAHLAVGRLVHVA